MSQESESRIVHIKSEEEDYYADDDIYKFSSWGADLSFRELIQRYADDELVKPELQRKYVWDKVEASRFIDSILLGLPVPSIFLAKEPDEKFLIIDGYQRILTVYDFVTGIFSKDKKVFKLSNSDRINPRWRGKAFSELGDIEQRRIRNTTIHAIIFVQSHPDQDDTGMYQVFERINTSGKTLHPQEIRNCIYQGNLNKLLFELNKNPVWRELYGDEEEDSRMRDLELILRFFAIDSLNLDEIKATSISLKKELNLFMGKKENNTIDKVDELRQRFILGCELALQMFGRSAFHNLSQTDPRKLTNKFSPTIFDSIMISISNNSVDTVFKEWEELRLKLLRDEMYQEAIRIRTTNVSTIKDRIRLATDYLFGDE